MEIEKPIPSKLIIKGQSAVITYKGQERTCFTCGSSSHEKCTCPARIARYNPINNRSQPSTNVPAAQPAVLNPTSRTDTEMHEKSPSTTPVISAKSTDTTEITGTTNTTGISGIIGPTDTSSSLGTTDITVTTNNTMDTSQDNPSTQTPATTSLSDTPRSIQSMDTTPSTETTNTSAVTKTSDTTSGPKYTPSTNASTTPLPRSPKRTSDRNVSESQSSLPSQPITTDKGSEPTDEDGWTLVKPKPKRLRSFNPKATPILPHDPTVRKRTAPTMSTSFPTRREKEKSNPYTEIPSSRDRSPLGFRVTGSGNLSFVDAVRSQTIPNPPYIFEDEDEASDEQDDVSDSLSSLEED